MSTLTRRRSITPNNNNIMSINTTTTTFYQRHCIYFPAMAGWFICSAALSAYNKFIFGASLGAFPCPLLLTSIHFLVQWTFSYSLSSMFPIAFGGGDVKDMTWRTYLGVSIPCGFVTAFDIGLSNLSLVRISITFFTMVKSSSPVWVLLSAFIFGLEKITCNLIMVGLLITGGEILTAFGEVEFDTVGFLLVLGAAICGGIRWTLVQFKLQKLDPPLQGPVVTMRVLSSTMFCSMLIMSIIIEKPWTKLGPSQGDYFNDFDNAIKTIATGLAGAFIAIVMVLCEFWLILRSNAIVLMIGGVLKEMITIFVGVTLFGDNLNLINVSGIIVVFLGVVLYKVTHYLSAENERRRTIDESNKAKFSSISQVDGSEVFAYEDETSPRVKRKDSYSDMLLSYRLDDDGFDDDDEEEESDGSSPLRASPTRDCREREKSSVVELV